MAKTEKPVWALLIPTADFVVSKKREDRGLFEHSAFFEMSVVTIEHGLKIRNGTDHAMSGMAFRFHLYRRHNDNKLDVSVAAEWRDVYSVDFRRAGEMAKFAGSVTRALAKLEKRFGYARSWQETLRRYCDAMRITQCAQRTRERVKSGWSSYDDADYRFGDVSRAEYWIAEIIEKLDPEIGQHRAQEAA